MKPLRLALMAIALALPALASAQWQWVDKSGRKVFSDQPPPADVPAANILKAPGGKAALAAMQQQQQAAEAAPVATAAPAAAPVPKITGKDKALEDRKKQAEAAEAEKKRAEEEKIAAARSENCTRFKRAKAQLDSGERIVRLNDKGEREYLDDAARAVEAKRLDGLIARDCKAS